MLGLSCDAGALARTPKACEDSPEQATPSRIQIGLLVKYKSYIYTDSSCNQAILNLS